MPPVDPNAPVYVVSDLHLGDGTAKDNFLPYRRRFERFLDGIAPDAQLVLAGDVFEFWQCQHGAIVREYLPLLRRLVDMDAIFIVGNHDIDLLGFVDLPLGDRLTALLCEDLPLERGGRTIRIYHGHEFDTYNDPKRWLFLGRVMTILAGQAEIHFGPEIGGQPTEALLSKLWNRVRKLGRVLWFPLLWLYRCFRKTPAESQRKRKKHLGRVLKFKRDHPEIDVIVAGHTHEAGTCGDWYVNTGSWQSADGAAYAVIAADGSVTLQKPDGAPVVRVLCP
ncbi:MAG: UDP-2,3-diacylglucosamine diphosphatase [Phycisphaerae bacterium]|nr:UDP-2,3-diacylglucosamine diphosphatase [Phycisphaerae bacterium]